MECKCPEEANEGWWMSGNNVQMGTFAVVGYLLYKFSQTLPALIRWPIRLFCSLTGISALWGWVSHLVGTIRGIQSMVKWLSCIWRFIFGIFAKLIQLVTVVKPHSESQTNVTTGSMVGLIEDVSAMNKPALRLILLGPSGGGRTSLSHTLLGISKTSASADSLLQSTEQRTVVDGVEIYVIDTPDLLGASLSNNKRALEALRSLQLTRPGPHAFLLVTRVPGSNMGEDQDAHRAIQNTLELFGDEASGHIIPVLTHADQLGPRLNVDQLLKAEAGHVGRVVSLCDQRPELVDNRPDLSPEKQSLLRRSLVRRAMEIKELNGHFVHELQSREDHLREELLCSMSSALGRKLEHT